MKRALFIVGFCLTAARSAQGQVDFGRDVLPILADNCYLCHGPDDKLRKADLRFDKKESAFRTVDGVTPIVPGKSGASEMIERIFSDGPDRMPPQESNRSLTAKQKETLKKWIDEGAKWGKHWAYEPLPKTVAVPGTKANPIDSFIQHRLKKEGLSPSPPALKETWLRRVSFDLTGLPPTLKEVNEFLKDDSPRAFEKVVDRLLDSPRYGERMASDWLDLARYADTYGYQHDRARPMWPWRDWVIKSFNENKKYDQFLTEQLAGDMLPKATKNQRLATAFNRLHMQNEEGGVIEEEFRVAYVVDRVNTFGTAFLGQTFECSRCHDHKYDPISQKDYYSLFAFFQNIDESGQTSFFTNAMNTPTLLLSTPEQDQIINDMKSELWKLELNNEQLKHSKINKILLDRGPGKKPLPLVEPSGLIAHFPFDDVKFTGGKLANTADPKLPGKPIETPIFKKLWDDRTTYSLSGDNGFEFPGVGHFTRSDPFSIVVTVKYDSPLQRAVILHHSKVPVDAGSRGYELSIEDDKIAFGLHHMWPGNSLKVRTVEKCVVGSWNTVAIVYDGTSQAPGVSVFVNGRKMKLDFIRNQLTKDVNYENGEPHLTLGYRFRDNGFKDGVIDDLKVFNRALKVAEIATVNDLPVDESDWIEYQIDTQFDDINKGSESVRLARRKLANYINSIPEIMVMEELRKPKPSYVLKRGAYDSHGEPVTANLPPSIAAYPFNAPRNRLGLAQWLTQLDHPLTARVAANRLWQQLFGRGLVETSENFGSTGTPPTHPELLDWLARDFIDNGWDIKRTLKQMVLSETYRQSSRTTLEVRTKDPHNLLLARTPVRRLTAEMLRDQALFSSGLLVEKPGGPSVYPYQPTGVWDDAMGKPKYPQSKGDDLYRRSLYTHWKRTAPPPAMTTFDAADKNICTARRQATSTPLQALVLLNDPQFVEAARLFAERIMTEGGDDKFAWAFRTLLGRNARAEELQVLKQLFDEQKALIDATAAAKLLGIGEKKRNEKLDAIEVAAYTQVALTILNHDEAVNRR